MKNSLMYLTRRCPRNCGYCSLRDAVGVGTELNTVEWIEAFRILTELKVDFNLILGNETWLLGTHVLDILKDNKVAYALYTTCPEPFFTQYKLLFFESGIVDNFSCGIDYPSDLTLTLNEDSYRKSQAAWKGFRWVKDNFPNIDTQGTVTVHKNNIAYLPRIVKQLSDLGVFVGVNFIHWNKEGGFDFFPKEEEIQDLLFTPRDYPFVNEMLKAVLRRPGLLQNPEFIKQPVEVLCNMGWHCKGNPYGGPTVDSDGHLRCCGYRRGIHTPKYTIFDLPAKEKEWQEAVHEDAMQCPGCAWSYPWMFHYWEEHNSELGKDVFKRHAGEHIDKSKWSERNIK